MKVHICQLDVKAHWLDGCWTVMVRGYMEDSLVCCCLIVLVCSYSGCEDVGVGFLRFLGWRQWFVVVCCDLLWFVVVCLCCALCVP